MRILLKVTDGPHKGLDFSFARHDTFLVGRSKHAHFQLPDKDKFFSRIHFMIEVNPPECRLVDMGSHNGTFVNGQRVLSADLKDGDQIRAGHTMLQLKLEGDASDTLSSVRLSKEAATDQPVPGYRLERKIGVGNMGVVYLAKREADGAAVALKVVAPASAVNPVQTAEFLKEVCELTALTHANIVRLLECGHAGERLFFATEYIAGMDAAALLKKQGPVQVARAVHILAQVLEALEYGHANGVVHRDIKPGNILVSGKEGEETARLADYALARLYQASPLSGLTVTRTIALSAPFLPPEVITNYRGAEPASDQYAAAATLYWLLTGKPVYDFPEEMHLKFSLLLQQQPVPIRKRRPELRDSLAAVIHKALQRNPANRFKDVGHFRRALVGVVRQ